MSRDADLLADMLDMIELVKRHAPASEEAFIADEVLQAAVLHWVQTIGEAATGVSEEVRARHPEIPWRKIVDMRNLVVHGYRHVQLSIVWQVMARDLPALEAQVRRLLAELS
ncbi:MAG: HepT-like ribonuclease domain-containing protein [Acidimicrobiales bacterium]